MAEDLIYRSDNAPQIEGWSIDPEASTDARDKLAAINHRLAIIDRTKEKISTMTKVEIKLTEGMTPEAFSVYRTLFSELSKGPGTSSRAARMNAILFARHADNFARVISEKTGRKYTAKDYYQERFALGFDGQQQANALSQPITDYSVDLNKPITAVTIERKFSGKDWTELADNFPEEITEQIVTNKDKSSRTHKPIVNEATGRKVVFSRASVDHMSHAKNSGTKDKGKAARRRAIEHYELIAAVPEIIKNGVWIEEHVDKHYLEQKLAGKNPAETLESVGSIYCPVCFSDDPQSYYVAKVTIKKSLPQKRKGVMPYEHMLEDGTATPYRAYDVYWEIKKDTNSNGNISRSEYSNEYTRQALITDMPFELSIKDFLSDVNDYLNKKYIDEEGKPNYGVYTKNGVMYLQPGDIALGEHYGQMAGVKAKNAPLEKLEQAKAMYYDIKSADEIWKATGWKLGADDKWRFEIPDNITQIDLGHFPKIEGVAASLDSLYDNPQLYEAYPFLRKIYV